MKLATENFALHFLSQQTLQNKIFETLTKYTDFLASPMQD